ncbi:hypothetical protein [Paenibacillus lactis]|uniref:hypothetical protein n=1 Tax=Paenibacillus lactis TaxID=228574 RepID=UPI003D73054D
MQIVSNKKLKCLSCEKHSVESNFYINHNPLFSSTKVLVCKKCISAYIGEKGSDNYLDRVKLVLALLNKPFLEVEWLASDEDWSKYIPKISSLPNFKGKYFSDSTIYTLISHDNSYKENQLTIPEEEFKQLEMTWGKGFEIDDYLFLENQFDTLVNSYECDSYAQEMLFQEIAHQRLTISKLREAQKPTDKELKTLQDLLGSSNIKPVQETGANSTEQATFGTLIKKYENDRPVPSPDPLWEDVDGIKRYIQIWFLGHLCRMLGIKNEYSTMYEEEINKYKVDAPVYEEDEEESS